jgi:hypothetical protein
MDYLCVPLPRCSRVSRVCSPVSVAAVLPLSRVLLTRFRCRGAPALPRLLSVAAVLPGLLTQTGRVTQCATVWPPVWVNERLHLRDYYFKIRSHVVLVPCVAWQVALHARMELLAASKVTFAKFSALAARVLPRYANPFPSPRCSRARSPISRAAVLPRFLRTRFIAAVFARLLTRSVCRELPRTLTPLDRVPPRMPRCSRAFAHLPTASWSSRFSLPRLLPA